MKAAERTMRQAIRVSGLILLGTVLGMNLGHAQLKERDNAMNAEIPDKNTEFSRAIFAGGCFWCMEAAFEKCQGVLSVVSGYAGGDETRPSYHEVASGQTGHREAVEVTFDPRVISYEDLLDVFWRNIDPTQADGQFADLGPQYTTAIFYLDEQQKQAAEASKARLEASGRFSSPIVTAILPATPFFPAEEYHQDYYKKNPAHYRMYHYGSGRGPFIEKVWGNDADGSCPVKE